MCKYGHAFIIILILLHCWLTNDHFCKRYKTKLWVLILEKQPFLQLSDVDLVVFCFRKLAKSNSIITSFHISAEDRLAFEDYVIFAY